MVLGLFNTLNTKSISLFLSNFVRSDMLRFSDLITCFMLFRKFDSLNIFVIFVSSCGQISFNIFELGRFAIKSFVNDSLSIFLSITSNHIFNAVSLVLVEISIFQSFMSLTIQLI
ncbi:MAG: hypothetical protein ACOZBL_04900 [Patescibacteria group bacterium]